MKKFSRRTEDFVCANCGTKVAGNGYTNHCPSCLWSQHVDVNPGDRASSCRGLMEPLHIEQHGSKLVLVTRCTRCGHQHRNRTSNQDSTDAIIAVSRVFSENQARQGQARASL
jgi:DNA-directed RNA polymerase subunit RPC12/RpoP